MVIFLMNNTDEKIYKSLLLAVVILCGLVSCKVEHNRLFIGGFTKPDAKGLSVYDFNPRNGDLELVSEAQVGP